MTDHLPASARPIAEIIEDCQKWLSSTISFLFYTDGSALPGSSLPKLYADWINNSATQSSFRQPLLHVLRENAERMNTALQDAKKQAPPQQSDFQKFMMAYDGFMSGLNDVQTDYLLSGIGIDVATGFKSSALVLPEMKREFERRGRQGNPFSVIMLRIDGSGSDEDNNFKIYSMASAMNKCLRGFDDVYKLNDTDLLVSLKLSDIKGGLRFVERLKLELKNINAEFTFSSCVAEPDPSNDLTKFLKDLEMDLIQVAAHGGGQTVKFEEVSPLQRFISTMKTAQ